MGPKRTAKIGINFLKNKHLLLLSHPSDRVRGERVVGPGVLGVAALELLPDLEVGPFPETAEVGGQLHRFETRGKKFHQDGTAAIVHARGVQEAEAFLQAYAHDGRVGSLPVFHADAAAGRDGDVRGGEPLYGLLLGVGQQRPERRAEVDPFEFGSR